MLPLSPLRFSTIGKPILRTFEILIFFLFFDNSSRTRAKATARAMARATARARRTRARVKDRARARARDGRTDGRPYGAIYLAKCATPVSDFERELAIGWVGGQKCQILNWEHYILYGKRPQWTLPQYF